MYYFVPAWYGTDRIWQQTATLGTGCESPLNLTIPLIKFVFFKKQKWIGSYCCLNIVHNCAIFAPPRFVRDRCAFDF